MSRLSKIKSKISKLYWNYFQNSTCKWQRAIWWVRHRTTNRFHFVMTGLKPGYYELDYRLLYACFNEFIKWYDECGEHFNEQCWECTENSEFDRKIKDEAKYLYDWWKNRDEDEESLIDIELELRNKNSVNTSTEHFIRLVKLLPALWT